MNIGSHPPAETHIQQSMLLTHPNGLASTHFKLLMHLPSSTVMVWAFNFLTTSSILPLGKLQFPFLLSLSLVVFPSFSLLCLQPSDYCEPKVVGGISVWCQHHKPHQTREQLPCHLSSFAAFQCFRTSSAVSRLTYSKTLSLTLKPWQRGKVVALMTAFGLSDHKHPKASPFDFIQ